MKRLIFLFTFLLFISSQHVSAHIEVSNSWARLVPNGMGALYFDIQNSHSESDILVRASSPNAKSVMLHETQRKDNIASMKHLVMGIKIPESGNVSLKPGSFHIMISGLDQGLKLGDKIEVLLEFKNNENITLYPILKIKPPKL